MGRVHDIRVRSNQFVANIGEHVERSIMFVESDLLDLNREQMKNRQVDSNDNPLPEYSPYFKAIKKLQRYNLYDTGDFQKKMKISAKYPIYSITSTDWKLPILLAKVGARMFGIAPSNKDKAQQYTVKSLGQIYKSQVFK